MPPPDLNTWAAFNSPDERLGVALGHTMEEWR
jgi:hypothetical protein